ERPGEDLVLFIYRNGHRQQQRFLSVQIRTLQYTRYIQPEVFQKPAVDRCQPLKAVSGYFCVYAEIGKKVGYRLVLHDKGCLVRTQTTSGSRNFGVSLRAGTFVPATRYLM